MCRAEARQDPQPSRTGSYGAVPGDRLRALAGLYEEAVEAFAVAEGKAPNLSERRLLMAEAWAAFHAESRKPRL